MDTEVIYNNKVLITLGGFTLTLFCVLWEYFNGGVVTHHLLANKDLPGFSNWWGLLAIPLLTWSTIALLHKRKDTPMASGTKILNHFWAALVFGTIASLLWEFNFVAFLQYYILLPILIAFFKPLHLPEYLLGFVFGMLFTFGGILPIIIGLILLALCFIVNRTIGILKKLFL